MYCTLRPITCGFDCVGICPGRFCSSTHLLFLCFQYEADPGRGEPLVYWQVVVGELFDTRSIVLCLLNDQDVRIQRPFGCTTLVEHYQRWNELASYQAMEVAACTLWGTQYGLHRADYLNLRCCMHVDSLEVSPHFLQPHT